MVRILLAALVFGAIPSVFATGVLTVESSPNGAEVWFTGPDDPDKKYLGDTPLENRELPTGRYDLWLILPSHDTLAVPDVRVQEGLHTLINREIPTHYGYLELLTSPDSAEIWLDGVKVGVSPFENNLMLPGDRKLRIDSPESMFRNTAFELPIQKGDTIRKSIVSLYRNKSFLVENLSLTPWTLGLEIGIQQRMTTGYYDTTERDPFSNSEKRSQTDFPIGARLGLPRGFEIHLLLPFKNFDDKKTFDGRDSVSGTAVFPSNLKAGLKYTYRPYNVGADISWGLGFEDGNDALPNDFLALTLMGMASKGNIVVDAQAGFEFHFSDKDSSELDYGDQAMVHGRIGYLLDPFLPYLGLTGQLRLNSSNDGDTQEDGGYLVIPELGCTVEIDDLVSFQLGIPFTLLGKRDVSYWGVHGSLAFTFGIL